MFNNISTPINLEYLICFKPEFLYVKKKKISLFFQSVEKQNADAFGFLIGRSDETEKGVSSHTQRETNQCFFGFKPLCYRFFGLHRQNEMILFNDIMDLFNLNVHCLICLNVNLKTRPVVGYLQFQSEFQLIAIQKSVSIYMYMFIFAACVCVFLCIIHFMTVNAMRNFLFSSVPNVL